MTVADLLAGFVLAIGAALATALAILTLPLVRGARAHRRRAR